ncbi:unnamed protein product [Prorocentrum cordatum]|uniref:Uncharacterized protein n=1 Tax=Prorocentrum cordatum TaxID=2364126 RepID=A0ABN9T3Z4_9DINO|nr:unnamed protein product [Polarella glacialis]
MLICIGVPWDAFDGPERSSLLHERSPILRGPPLRQDRRSAVLPLAQRVGSSMGAWHQGTGTPREHRCCFLNGLRRLPGSATTAPGQLQWALEAPDEHPERQK